MPSKTSSVANATQQLVSCTEVLRREYLRNHSDPWVVAYSGGKDSTLLLQIIWEMLISLPGDARHREIHVVGNDTLVESPLVIDHLRATLSKIGKAATKAELPITSTITKPHIDHTFWVNVIGKGYIPPTRNFRWCTDRMKIIPTSQLLDRLVKQHGRAVLLVGTRKSESTNRRKSMNRHGANGTTMNSHSTVSGCMVFSPLAEFTDDDVWMILMQRKAPWGGTHRKLITLYRNAGGGECPLVLTKEDAPSCGTTSPRFGCWTCTVIQKDRSLRGLIDSGHEDAELFESLFDFREWLIELRENDTNRQSVRRNGFVKSRNDGSRVMGPFTMEVRKKILRKLRKLENESNRPLITDSEIEVIEDIWRRDKLMEECREALHKFSNASEAAEIT